MPGIVEAHRRGILTATTLMANGEAFDDAVRLARETPTLDIGCHLVLVGGRSLVTGKPFPASVPQLLAALARREIRPYEELAGTGAAHCRCGHRAHAPGHAQAHAPGAAGAGCGGAPQRGVRHPLGAPPVRFSADALRGAVPRMKRADQRRPGPAAPPLPPRPGTAWLPDHGPFRGLSDHRPLSHRRTGGVAGRVAGRQYGADVPSRKVRGSPAARAHSAEGEPRARTGGVSLRRSARSPGTRPHRTGQLPGVGGQTSVCGGLQPDLSQMMRKAD